MTQDSPNRRSRQKEQTRELILAAAGRAFAAKGFEKTTIRAIARQAGVAVGTVFVHFPDKSALLAAALYDIIAIESAAAWATLPAAAAPLDKLLHLARQLYYYYAADPALSRVLLKETMFLDGEWGQAHTEQAADFMTAVAAMLAAGDLPPGRDPARLAASFFAHYLFVLIDGLRRPEFDVAAQVEQLRGLLTPLFAE